MKLNELKSALTDYQKLKAEITGLETLQQQNNDELSNLETTCDLADETALDKITRLHVVIKLLPQRITARQDAAGISENNLVASVESFIGETIRPKINSVLDLAKEKIRKTIRAVYSNSTALEDAVDKSGLVSGISDISDKCSISHAPEDVVKYVSSIIGIWEEISKIEKTL